MVAPPRKNQSDSKESSHCVVDQIPNLNVFVIFYKRHFYPEYLVTFSWWFFYAIITIIITIILFINIDF